MTKVRKDRKTADGPVDYEEAITLVGFGKFHYLLILVGGCSLFISLTATLDITYILPAAECELRLQKSDRGVLSGAFFIGIVVSSHFLGFISDTLGRRYIIVKALFANIVIYVASSLSPNYWFLLIIRFLTGIVLSGVSTSAIVYVGEFHSNAYRTRSLMLSACISTLAYIYSAGLGGWILPGDWSIPVLEGYFLSPWRVYYFVVGVVPSVIIGSLMLILPESPKYLLACCRQEEAVEVLRKVYRCNTGNPKDKYPVKSLQLNPDEQVAQLSGQTKNLIAMLRVIWNQTYPLFAPPHLLNMLCSCTMLFCIFYLQAGILIWIPDVFNQLLILKDDRQAEPLYFCQLLQSNWSQPSTVHAPLASQAGTLLPTPLASVAGEDIASCKTVLKASMFELNMLIGVILFLCTFALTFVIPKLKRKVFVSIMSLMTIGCVAALLHVPDVFVMMSSQGFIIVLINVMFCAMSTLLVDYFPTNYRGMAVCLAVMTGRLGSAVGGHVFSLYLLSSCSNMYYVSSALMFLAAVCCVCLQSPSKHLHAGNAIV